MRVQLIHPTFGVCADVEVYCQHELFLLKKTWKYRYGKNYHRSEVKVDGKVQEVIKMVMHIPTGELYGNNRLAGKAYGCTANSVWGHTKRYKLKKGLALFKRVKYDTIKGQVID